MQCALPSTPRIDIIQGVKPQLVSVCVSCELASAASPFGFGRHRQQHHHHRRWIELDHIPCLCVSVLAWLYV